MMAKYRLNTTKCVLKWPKKHQKVPIFNKITLSTWSAPPLRLIHFFQINNIHIKEFFIHILRPPSPPIAYPHWRTPPPLIHKMWIICLFFNHSLSRRGGEVLLSKYDTTKSKTLQQVWAGGWDFLKICIYFSKT